MRWEEVNNQTCSIARSITFFGDRWTLLILREIFLKVRRFSDLQKSLEISRHRLSDRLSRLVEVDILYKEIYDEKRNRFEYKLTEKGLDLYPIILSIVKWGDKWETDKDGAPMEYIHKDCGKSISPVLSCSECGEELHARNTMAQIGPGITKKIARGEDINIDLSKYSAQISPKEPS